MGHAATESLALRAVFSPGSACLVVVANRVVFVDDGAVAVQLFGVACNAATQRDFFTACVEGWFRAPLRPNLVAAWIDANSTAVLAIGNRGAVVRTNEDKGSVDPAVANFAAERVFRGALVSLRVGEDSGELDADDLTFVVEKGIVPVGLVEVAIALDDILVPVGASLMDSVVATEAFAPDAVPSTLPQVINRIFEPITTPFESDVSKDLAEPLVEIPCSNAVLPTAVVEVDLIEDGMDWATVWPARKAPIPSDAQVVSFPSWVAASANQDLVSGPLGEGEQLVQPNERRALANRFVRALNPAEGDDHEARLAHDEWVPPADYLPSDISRSPEPRTTSWISNVHASSSVPNADDEYVDDMTMMAGDLDRIRKSFVDVVAPTGFAESDKVLGTYCARGHFTDSRVLVCIFCSSETDFARIESAPRPLLGSLVFDDGRTFELDRGVVVGRKPSTGESGMGFVAFEDDRMLSRNHAEVRLVDWNVVAVDRQSVNGTTIEHADGRRMAARPNIETKLEDGSVVRFGSHYCTYRKPS